MSMKMSLWYALAALALAGCEGPYENGDPELVLKSVDDGKATMLALGFPQETVESLPAEEILEFSGVDLGAVKKSTTLYKKNPDTEEVFAVCQQGCEDETAVAASAAVAEKSGVTLRSNRPFYQDTGKEYDWIRLETWAVPQGGGKYILVSQFFWLKKLPSYTRTDYFGISTDGNLRRTPKSEYFVFTCEPLLGASVDKQSLDSKWMYQAQYVGGKGATRLSGSRDKSKFVHISKKDETPNGVLISFWIDPFSDLYFSSSYYDRNGCLSPRAYMSMKAERNNTTARGATLVSNYAHLEVAFSPGISVGKGSFGFSLIPGDAFAQVYNTTEIKF